MPNTTLSANGIAEPPIPMDAEQLTVVLDGNTLKAGSSSLSIELAESIHYKILSFLPGEDGSCQIKYARIPH